MFLCTSNACYFFDFFYILVKFTIFCQGKGTRAASPVSLKKTFMKAQVAVI